MKHKIKGVRNSENVSENDKNRGTESQGKSTVCYDMTTDGSEAKTVCYQVTTVVPDVRAEMDKNNFKENNNYMNESAGCYEDNVEQIRVSSQ